MQDLKQRYQKFLSRECSAEEISYLMEHFHLEGSETELKDLISAQLASDEFPEQDDEEVATMLRHNSERIRQKIQEEHNLKISPWRTYLKMAAVLALITAGTMFYFKYAIDGQFYGEKRLVSGDVGPGSNKATLRLSNGETIHLDQADEGLVVQKNGLSYAKIIGGKLTCLAQSSANADTAYNTITTPEGGIYQLVTPDGSKIWLNASSELRFPSSFGDGDRVVVLKGEAYFEIAKDKKRPFIVKTIGQKTEVLGTHFNVNSYADDLSTTTTLFEGAVRVSGSDTDQQVLLSPGQASVLKDRRLMVKKADASAAIDWVKGKIVFNNEPLENIMRKVSRWYGVEVEINSDIAGLKFWGSVSRKDNLSAILNYLKETEDLDYRITGKSVTLFKRESTANK